MSTFCAFVSTTGKIFLRTWILGITGCQILFSNSILDWQMPFPQNPWNQCFHISEVQMSTLLIFSYHPWWSKHYYQGISTSLFKSPWNLIYSDWDTPTHSHNLNTFLYYGGSNLWLSRNNSWSKSYISYVHNNIYNQIAKTIK